MFRRSLHTSIAVVFSIVMMTAISCAAQAATDSVLATTYKDKLVALPGPTCGPELKFDSNAKFISRPVLGDWAKCSGIRIRDVHVEEGKIKITAERVPISYDCETRQLRAAEESSAGNGQQVSIEVQLPPPGDDTAALGLMKRLFRSDEDLTSSGRIHRVGVGVSAPVVVHAPDPDYSDQARQAGFEGTVTLAAIVGEDGRVKQVRVSRSLGMGLDENAVETVKRWRFKPATFCGTAVPVEVNIEVTFHLARGRSW